MKMIPTQYQQKIVLWRVQTNGIMVFVQTCNTMLSDDLAWPGLARVMGERQLLEKYAFLLKNLEKKRAGQK